MSSFRTIELSDPQFEMDGLRFITVKSEHLKGRGDICLYTPISDQPLINLPIYILLHGVYGSAWAWALKGGAHRMATKLINSSEIKPAIIAMPSDGLWGDGSGYINHAQNFENWIVDDVPQAIIECIPAASSRSPICIGGLSMGGFGALMLGGKYPDRFKAVSGHSSITKLEQMAQFVEEALEDYRKNVAFENVIDLYIDHKEKLPPIRFDCGLDDPLLQANQELHQALLAEAIPHVYEEFSGGHQWSYWQTHLNRTLLFFDQYA
ncbi:MAG: alpha/beta hydrolase-fold protein [Bacteroidota bacterium]